LIGIVRCFLVRPVAMTTAPRRFDTDDQFLAYLGGVNPRCDYAPPDFDFIAAAREARTLHQRFLAEFGPGVSFDGDGGVQDASYHAGIYIPPHGEVRLSNFDHLATITREDCIPQPALSRIIRIVEASGYTYIPFRLFGECFDSRDRFNGDLFNQLFDYL
jgi:hypothetical protein